MTFDLKKEYCYPIEKNITIREYRAEDCERLAKLFYSTVHTVNAKDYTRDQLDAWAPENMDLTTWNQSFLAHYSLVAEEGHEIVGFGDIDKTGYLDRLYVHKDHQNKGIASEICSFLEQTVSGKVVTHTSITARPFFERRGYRIVKEQQVERQGIVLTNFIMERSSADLENEEGKRNEME